MNEFEEQVEIEKEKAAVRRRVTQNNDSAEEEAECETFHTQDEGRATEIAAEKINADVSGRSIEKGKKVKDIATGEEQDFSF